MSSQKFNCITHTVLSQHIRHYHRSTHPDQEVELKVSVKQYVPRNYEPQAGDITILASHANAMPKELYEPLWDALLAYTERTKSFRIRGIWIADVVNQGASGLLNAEFLGTEHSNFDHARDWLLIVNSFRKEIKMPIIGLGHSQGGNVMTNLALMHPRLLATVILIEPSINESATSMNFRVMLPLISKKDQFSCRDQLAKSMDKNVLFKSWDPAVKELYVQHGLRKLESGTTTLTTSKHQEVTSFGRPAYPSDREEDVKDFKPDPVNHYDYNTEPGMNTGDGIYKPEPLHTFTQLPFLRPACLYLYGSKSHMGLARPAEQNAKLDATGTAVGGSGGAVEGRVQSMNVEGTSHWIPFEQPSELAMQYVGPWIDKEMKVYAEEQDLQYTAWLERVPKEKRGQVDEEWMHWMQKIHGKKPESRTRSKGSKL